MERDYFIELYLSRIENREDVQHILGEIYDSYVDINTDFKIKTRNQKINAIIASVIDVYNISHQKLILRTRKREIVEARQIASYLIKNSVNISLNDVGSLLGGFGHSNVLHSIKTVENLLQTDKQFKYRYNQIILKLLKLNS